MYEYKVKTIKRVVDGDLSLKSKEWMKDRLSNIEGKELVVKFVKEEKYGRLLGWLYFVGEPNTLNEQLINEGLALPYMTDQL